MRSRRPTSRPCRPEYSSFSGVTPVFLAIALLPSLISASTYDCSHVRVGGRSFDLSALGGPRSIHHLVPTPPAVNSTISVDVCKPLRRIKGVPNTLECPNLTRVCSIVRAVSEDGSSNITSVIPIAGDYVHSGRPLNANFTLPGMSCGGHKASDTNVLRLSMHGGRYPFEGRHGRKQRAVIDFVCDKDRTGLEGLEGEGEGEGEGVVESSRRRTRTTHSDDRGDHEDGAAAASTTGSQLPGADGDRVHEDDNSDADPDKPTGDGDDHRASLRYVDYRPTSEDSQEDTLWLTWHTKYACARSADDDKKDKKDPEKDKDGHDQKKRRGWGLFTWFIIIDTLRDIPYLLKDFSRRVVSTVQGGGGRVGGAGSRGGYSAV
ncbi:MAG: hypothetical protein M1826_001624 [Phylliscum demangeonii]|nr:MAG: hypothetical protein M1826_001624 [Phylliscum demangeonii]